MRGPPPRHPDEPREQLPPVEGFIADAAELDPGVRVVYPNQGVCTVVGLEEKDIAGQKLPLVHMRREEDGSSVFVPRNKVPTIGLRRVATGPQLEGVFHYLAAQFGDPELDWKIRHRDNADRLIAGGVLGLAEVVKGLHSLSRLRPLPTKEREQYDNARHLLVLEVAVSLGAPPSLAEDYIDYALLPPAGVTFDVPPPPAPVTLPSRAHRRRVAVEDDSDLSDLGLGDLGIELDLDGAVGGAAVVAVVADGAEGGVGSAVEGGASEEAETVQDAAEGDEPEPAIAKEPPPPPDKGRPAKARPPPERSAAKVKKPAPKKHAKKESKEKQSKPPPREKPARKPAKAAQKRGGKKK